MDKEGGGLLDKISIGSRVGMLTVKEATQERGGGYIIWKCRCDCGGEICLDTRRLKRGNVRNCGCVSGVRTGRRDITGQRFGQLTALRSTGERGARGGTLWLCRCDCGNEIEAELRELTSGNRKSCGCLRHPALKKLIGRRFGQLTVVSYAGKTEGMHRWNCVCDCGKETVVGQTLLQSGRTKSCGCLQAAIHRENLQLMDGTSVTVIRAVKGGRVIKSNKSGYNGVYLDKRRNQWVAQITFQGKTKYLGSYPKLEEAVKARQLGEEIYDEFLEQVDADGKKKDSV